MFTNFFFLFFFFIFFFFFNDTATTEIYTLSLHDALPIYIASLRFTPALVPKYANRPQSHAIWRCHASATVTPGQTRGRCSQIGSLWRRGEENMSREAFGHPTASFGIFD